MNSTRREKRIARLNRQADKAESRALQYERDAGIAVLGAIFTMGLTALLLAIPLDIAAKLERKQATRLRQRAKRLSLK